MALPALREDGWLPEGHHETTWKEIAEVFGGKPGSRRAQVLLRLLEWRDALRGTGVAGRVILNGSFISAKTEPGDFDLIFVYDESARAIINRDADAKALTDYTYCKAAGYGDVFTFAVAAVRAFPDFCRLDMFDTDKKGIPKGVVEVAL